MLLKPAGKFKYDGGIDGSYESTPSFLRLTSIQYPPHHHIDIQTPLLNSWLHAQSIKMAAHHHSRENSFRSPRGGDGRRSSPTSPLPSMPRLFSAPSPASDHSSNVSNLSSKSDSLSGGNRKRSDSGPSISGSHSASSKRGHRHHPKMAQDSHNRALSKKALMENDAMVYLDGPQVYTCGNCRTHLTSHDDIISKSFHGRHGEYQRRCDFAFVVHIFRFP